MQHAFLVQNSGWMESFYSHPDSKFKALVAAVIRSVARPEDPVFISAFSQRTASNPSPVPLYQGKGPGDPERWLGGLKVAVKNSAGALADTHFQEAVSSTITDQFKADPGIIWIFTNNKNSPDNDLRTDVRNEEFYNLLHLDPSITRTLAFPHRMALKGGRYPVSGMMVYALAYGEPASAHLAALADSGQLTKIFGHPPARLKPVDRDSVRLVPRRVTNSDNVAVTLAKDGRTLLVDVRASKVLPQVEVSAAVQNLLYPYVIDQARPAATLIGGWGRSEVPIRPERLDRVQPGEERTVSVGLPIPLAQVPSPLSPAALAAMGKRLDIPAVLQISLSGQRLVLSDEFRNLLEELFPGDPLSKVFLPKVFEPPQGVQSSLVSLPLVIRIQYSMLPLILAMLGGLVLLGGGVALAVVAGRPARYAVLVDGAKRNVMVKAFGSAQVRSADGTVVGSVSRKLGKPVVTEVAEGHAVVVS